MAALGRHHGLQSDPNGLSLELSTKAIDPIFRIRGIEIVIRTGQHKAACDQLKTAALIAVIPAACIFNPYTETPCLAAETVDHRLIGQI
jgi:hypothetical protein